MKKGDRYDLDHDWTAVVRKVWPKRPWRKEAKAEVWISPPNPDLFDPRILVVIGPVEAVQEQINKLAVSKESVDDQVR